MEIKGFLYAAVEAGIRASGRLDVGLIFCDKESFAAVVFKTNKVKAAPVLLDMDRIQKKQVRAILVNSGIANACTGEQGFETAKKSAAFIADSLGISEDMVLVSSTGVIGDQLEAAKFEKVANSLTTNLSSTGYDDVAKAIMTTDTVPKTAAYTSNIDGHEVKLFGMAKGSGMIMPNMATMLSFVMTDANISDSVLQPILQSSVEKSFNRITVDGDTSTNDMVLIMANGIAGNPIIDEASIERLTAFQEALDKLLMDLAIQIVKDGEGATKIVTIRVCGARNNLEAEHAARTIANSNLVKTAFFGEDANWGRIIAAVGRSEAVFVPEKVDILFNDIMMVQNGLGLGPDVEKSASTILQQESFVVKIDLKEGNGVCDIYTCDFSLDYVKINADYRS